jgi:hypothetical protein
VDNVTEDTYEFGEINHVFNVNPVKQGSPIIFSNVKKEAVIFSETSVNSGISRRYILEDNLFQVLTAVNIKILTAVRT